MDWLERLLRKNGDMQPLRVLERQTGISADVLRKAAQQERLRAEKRGFFWFSSVAAIERAISEGKIKGGER